MTLNNVIIHIKSVLNEDKSHYYYMIFLERYSYQLAKKWSSLFVHSIIMLGFRERNSKRNILCCKKPIKILNVNIDYIVISKLVETKSNSKYCIWYLDKAIRPLVLIMPKKSGYVKTLKAKDGDQDKSIKINIFLFGLRLKT